MRAALIVKAVAALAVGIVITFSQVHDAVTAMFGLLILSAGWFLSSVISIVTNQQKIANALLLLATAAMAWLALSLELNPVTPVAWVLIASWGLLGAIVEFVFALRSPNKSALRRDRFINAGLAFGLFLTQLPGADIDWVTHVGFFGAYAIILGVHLALAAASPKAKA